MLVSHQMLPGLVCLLLVVGACADSEDDPIEVDGGIQADAQRGSCELASAAPSWLMPMQRSIVSKLAGAEEIAPGVVLRDRASATSREQTRTFLTAELQALGYLVDRHNYGSGINLVASLAGSGTGVYIVGAHYDSVPNSPGANDNATGVAAVMASARLLIESECSFVPEIRFVFFDEEELGLVGSRAYATHLTGEGEQILGVTTVDQLGWDEDGDKQIEIELAPPGELQEIAASITRHGLNAPLSATSTSGTDHTAFREQGYPALGFTEEFVNGDTTPHYHLSSDVLATVNFDYLASSTAVINAYLWDLAVEGN